MGSKFIIAIDNSKDGIDLIWQRKAKKASGIADVDRLPQLGRIHSELT